MNCGEKSVALDTNIFYKEIGRRVKKVREARKMTQAALAERLDMTRTSITNIEKGEQKILIHTMVEIAQALRISLSSLLPEQYETREEEIDAVLKDEQEDAQKWIKSLVGVERRESHHGSST